MQTLNLCCTSGQTLYFIKNRLQSPKIRSSQSYNDGKLCHLTPQLKQNHHPFASNFMGFQFNPLRVSSNCIEGVIMKKKKIHGFGTVCYAGPLSPQNLQWISTISTVILMLVRGTSIHKAFLVPLFALQAPASIVSWIKGEYGIWSAFLALLVRLFFFIPGELELPFITLLLLIVAPYQVTKLRGTQEGIILSLVIAAYLAFQHYSRAGSLRKAFDQGSVVASLAIICIVAVPCLLLV